MVFIEQHFQYVAQNIMHDNNLDYLAACFDKHFTQKPSPQLHRKIMSFKIISIVNHNGGKLSCTLYIK